LVQVKMHKTMRASNQPVNAPAPRHEVAASADADPSQLGRRLDGLIGMLSHDLRTPLSAISGWLFLLESGKLDAQAQKRALSKIKSSVEEQVQLIDDTLLISRGQTGRFEVGATPLALRESLDPAIAALRPQAEAKNVALEAAETDPAALVLGDGELLQRAFAQLLLHALKATPSGGRVVVSSSDAGDRVVVEISDTGAGFSSGDLPYVFDPFRRRADEGADSASGSAGPRSPDRALLLAQAIIAAHRGTLSLASGGAGQGERFTINLPRP
jgi:signal transduction histidine kinase